MNAHHAIGSQESIRTTADHNSEETRLPILSADLVARKVFANNLDIGESLPSSRMTTNDHLSDTPSTYMSADLAARKVFAVRFLPTNLMKNRLPSNGQNALMT